MADILLVDDDADLSELMKEVLEDEGHHVRVARDGAEGLRALEPLHPDVVVLDVEMPVLTGPGMMHGMLVHDCGEEEIPIVLTSGIDGLSAVAATVGTPYFLAKPYPIADLLRLLTRALVERRAPVPARSLSP